MCRNLVDGWEPADDRTECTSVPVPVDYGRPGGRTIDIAVSRRAATDPAHRRGVVLFNPGGPGQPGIEQPRFIGESAAAGIGTDHDLVGFDPRGVQFSAPFACPERPEDSAEPPAGLPEEERARFVFDRDARANKRCVKSDPEFVRNLTTENVARDMDRIRVALGEDKIGFYGVSWGTALGAGYRTLFDDHVDRMLLDSVMAPTLDLADMDDAMVRAVDLTVHDFASWVACYDTVYGFGKTQPAVLAALLDLRTRFAEHPREVDGVTIDGDLINNFLAGSRRDWTRAADALVAIRDGGAPAAGAVRETGPSFGSPDWHSGLTGLNADQQKAIFCNSSTEHRDFETVWQRRLDRISAYPAIAVPGFWDGLCAGWPRPVQPWHFTGGDSPLQLVGHLYEPVTPIEWTHAMRAAIGGAVLTVEDDHHGSLSSLPCADRAVTFFSTGRTSTGSCAGEPIPQPAGR